MCSSGSVCWGERYSELFPLTSHMITKMNHDSQPTPRSGLCLYTIALRAEVSSISLDQLSLFLFPTDLGRSKRPLLAGYIHMNILFNVFYHHKQINIESPQ